MAADNETKKPYNEKKKEYNMKYQAEKLKRIPLDVQLDFYDEIKTAAGECGESVNGFIKTAIRNRLDSM